MSISESALDVEAVRARYEVEEEVDRVLTRKLIQRNILTEQSECSLDRVTRGVEALIAAQFGGDFSISNPRWLQGGSSKIQMAFEFSSNKAPSTASLVARLEPAESIVQTSRRREFELLQAMAGVVPVPPPFWLDEEGAHLPMPGLIYGFVDGVSKPTVARSASHGHMITEFSPNLRAKVGAEFVTQMAAIHTVENNRLASLKYFAHPAVGSNQSVLRQVNWWRRVWEEDSREAVPLVDVAGSWLLANAPVLDHVSVVHGDCRVGNFLFSEASGEITAWLDWELAVLGDRHQDLTWATGRMRRFAEDGKTPLVCGLLPDDEFYAMYESASGLKIDQKRLRYYRVFNDFVSTVHMLGTASRVAHDAKSHQDVVVAWISIVGNVIAGKLRATLEEVL
jgi:aminoglycoside phosphotransferase (APT) family kinase protein